MAININMVSNSNGHPRPKMIPIVIQSELFSLLFTFSKLLFVFTLVFLLNFLQFSSIHIWLAGFCSFVRASRPSAIIAASLLGTRRPKRTAEEVGSFLPGPPVYWEGPEAGPQAVEKGPGGHWLVAEATRRLWGHPIGWHCADLSLPPKSCSTLPVCKTGGRGFADPAPGRCHFWKSF